MILNSVASIAYNADPTPYIQKTDCSLTCWLLEGYNKQSSLTGKVGAVAALVIGFLGAAVAFVAVTAYIYREIKDSISTHPGLIETTHKLNESIKTGVEKESEELIDSFVDEFVEKLMKDQRVIDTLEQFQIQLDKSLQSTFEKAAGTDTFKAAAQTMQNSTLAAITETVETDEMKALDGSGSAASEAETADSSAEKTADIGSILLTCIQNTQEFKIAKASFAGALKSHLAKEIKNLLQKQLSNIGHVC
ncbi:MAG: hypothetical protein SP1CHLAM9_04010 [Chlamydiia bacterium]|nr:hypothetical protein [Chlamydiia bacterium]MCH9624490.1 hypothetical protein [Chlamydiia bacterium]